MSTTVEKWPFLRGQRPYAWAMFAVVLMDKGKAADAVDVALDAMKHPECCARARQLARDVLSRNVPRWHWALVRDERRNAAYETALKKVLKPGMTVLDIGTGSGILSLLAARAGADRVIACEENPAVARMAEENVRVNGAAARISVVAKNSRELSIGDDLDSPVDVVVSEIVDNTLLAEGVLETHRDVVDRLLRPGGHVIPAIGSIKAALAYDPSLDRRLMASHSGFDLSAFNRLHNANYLLPVKSPGLRLMSEPATLFRFAFGEPGTWPGMTVKRAVPVSAGTANTIVQWIRLEMIADGRPESIYEVDPREDNTSSWGLSCWMLERELTLTAGGTVDLCASRTDTHLRVWLE